MRNSKITPYIIFIILSFLPLLLFGCNADSIDKPESFVDGETVEPKAGPLEAVVEEDPETTAAGTDRVAREKVVVNVDILRLRSGPSTDYEILDRLAYGTILIVIAEDNGWLQVIAFDGREGWVSGDYVKSYDKKSQIRDEAAESMREDPCKTLRYLGMSKEEIIALHGEPNLVFEVPGPGGDYYVYNDLPISFIFAEQKDVVNNLDLGKGAEIRGIRIGMTLAEIEELWGVAGSKGYSEEFIDMGRYPWYAIYMLDSL